MTRLILAIKLFFRILFDADIAARARNVLEDRQTAREAPPAAPVISAPPAAKPSARSDAVGLLAVLQREARLIDFLMENISTYDDAQVGAAVRDVHRGSAAVVQRVFALKPVVSEAEGASITVPAGVDASRMRLTGNVSGQPPYRGTLRHAGWEATKVELPEWSGSPDAARVVAPAEVEV